MQEHQALRCNRCGDEAFVRAGRDRAGRQLHRCRACGRRLTARSRTAFRGRHFPDEVILLAVRWYVRYRLTYAEVAEWLAECGVSADPSTIWDWVQAYAPKLNEAARVHRAPAGTRWRVDETYVKVSRRQLYLYRAIDEHGQVLDCLLSDRRDTTAARLFLLWAQDRAGAAPTRVITDRAGWLLVEGLNNREIADRLGVGVLTVKTQIDHVCEKLEVSGTTRARVLAARAIRLGLVPASR
jgi:transposase-like protein